MWSKIFALHPAVQGWQALLEQYWIGHDQEPFAEYWDNPDQLSQFDWRASDWFVTSISVPYMNNGTATVPDFKRFVRSVQNLGHTVKFAVLGRDQNIVQMQQQRVRGGASLPYALAEFDALAAPVFLSYELLHLYKKKYLEAVARQLNFPIDINNSKIEEILAEDTNSKYFKSVQYHPTDDLAQHASRKWR